MQRTLGTARWLIMLMVLALVAAACAGGDGDDVTATEGPVETEVVEDDTEEPTEPTEADEDDTEEPTEGETEAETSPAFFACGGQEGDTPPADDTADDGTEADDTEGEDVAAAPSTGAVVLFGDEQEPTILNDGLLDGNSLVTTKVTTNILPSAYIIQPDLTYEPSVIDGEVEVGEDPFTLTYTIREDAVWSDGTPISSEDLMFTCRTQMNPDYAEQITSVDGYELITDAEVIDEKTVTFTLEEPFAAYQLLWSGIRPAHVLEGEDYLTVWNDGIIDPATGEGISGGPFMFDEWIRGQQMRLVRNDNYWGGDVGVDEIIMRYVGDTTTLAQQFRGGEITMFDPQPQIELIDTLDSIPNATYEVASGPVWEHIDFNHLVDGLDLVHVRQAIALGINRTQIVETLVQPIQPDAAQLDNIMLVNNQEGYEPHFDQWEHSPDEAIALLEDNGCVRGGDGIFECDGTRLSFRFGTTGGNQRRELTQQLVQADLQQVGIEITIENDEGAAFFERLDTPDNCGGVCDFDLALFAWVGGPDPGPGGNIFGCDRPQNWTGYCNQEASDIMDEANVVVDVEERLALFNEADALMAAEVPILPLFQQPQLAAWDNSITGPEINPTNQTIFWNSPGWNVTN
ncbi:hypothetical protein BH23ACT9_BH23ACT9_05730 [soil metagenome]